MLTPILLEGGAGALVIFGYLQWRLSGRAVKLASTSQELLDLFEALAPLEKEMVVPPSRHAERGDLAIRDRHKRRFRAYKLIRVAARGSGRSVPPTVVLTCGSGWGESFSADAARIQG